MLVPIEFHTPWRKSSFSGGDANCVEVAHGTWRKSSISGPDANCVEVACAAEVVAVRDSKNPEEGYLVFPKAAFLADYSSTARASISTRRPAGSPT